MLTGDPSTPTTTGPIGSPAITHLLEFTLVADGVPGQSRRARPSKDHTSDGPYGKRDLGL
jgi:hypothetical protein